MLVTDEQRKRRTIRMAIGLGVIAVAIYGGYIASFFLAGASG